MTVLIRRAYKTDARAIDKLAKEFAAYMRKLGCTYQFQFNGTSFLRDGFGSNSAFTCLLAKEKGRIIGYILGHVGYDSDAAVRNFHIADLFVTAKYRRRAIGLMLVQKLAALAAENGAQEMVWAIYKSNKNAEEFYRHLGGKKMRRLNYMHMPVSIAVMLGAP